MAYTAVELPADISTPTHRSRYCRGVYFITQDAFNDIVRHGTVYEIALATERHREMLIGFDSRGMSPLMCAADRAGDTYEMLDAVVKVLVNGGAKMDSGRFSHSTPLCYAAAKTPQAVRVFAKYETNWPLYASFDVKPWQIALRTSEENFAAMLPHIPTKVLATYDANGRTPLIELIAERPYLASKLAAQAPYRAMVNIPDANGEAPLAHAARLETYRHEVSTALIRCGAVLLYYKNNVAYYWGVGTATTRPGVEYIRDRIRFARDQTPFDGRYDRWYA